MRVIILNILASILAAGLFAVAYTDIRLQAQGACSTPSTRRLCSTPSRYKGFSFSLDTFGQPICSCRRGRTEITFIGE